MTSVIFSGGSPRGPSRRRGLRVVRRPGFQARLQLRQGATQNGTGRQPAQHLAPIHDRLPSIDDPGRNHQETPGDPRRLQTIRAETAPQPSGSRRTGGSSGLTPGGVLYWDWESSIQ